MRRREWLDGRPLTRTGKIHAQRSSSSGVCCEVRKSPCVDRIRSPSPASPRESSSRCVGESWQAQSRPRMHTAILMLWSLRQTRIDTSTVPRHLDKGPPTPKVLQHFFRSLYLQLLTCSESNARDASNLYASTRVSVSRPPCPRGANRAGAESKAQ